VSRNLLGALALIVLGLLAWQLRWVLLILFGAVTLGVALDVPTTLLMRPCCWCWRCWWGLALR
jgi:hypothetical protein